MSATVGDIIEEDSIFDSCIDVSCPSTPRAKQQAKISEKIENAIKQKHPCYSFEYFPPKTKDGLINLTERIRRMGWTQPLWVDITHSKLSKTMELAELLMEYSTVDIMVHLSMTEMTKKDIINFCDKCKEIGIRNILAIRGDPPRGYDTWLPVDDDLQHCADLVKLIRREYGSYFSVFVGGYPEGHHNSPNLSKDIKYLKEKVDAGADGIITQLFYDTSVFFKFVDKCRAEGISVPIIPGIMPIQTYATFVRVVSFSNVTVPNSVWSDLEPIKYNDEKVKEYGINYAVKMCREILDHGINTLHFYTFNLERSVTLTLEQLNLYASNDKNKTEKEFPWEGCKGIMRRKQESVRPIFWANRSESYLHRTAHWDEYPNGRWGDSRSPAYGEFLDHHLFRQNGLTVDLRRKMWGKQLNSIQDVCNVFISYLDTKINRLPWCDQKIGQETLTFLLEPLKVLNKYGFLSINSQPQVNGAPSTDPVVGWGRNNGYVYQKAYLEFFCSKTNCEKLLKIIDRNENNKYSTLTYQAISINSKLISNCQSLEDVNAVTWGVFPNCEILQPTIVDPMSFTAWKDEAFSLWKSLWQTIYQKESSSYKIINDICDNWYLVNIIENDYIAGNIFEPFMELFKDDKNHKHISNILNSSLQSQQKLWCCSQNIKNKKISKRHAPSSTYSIDDDEQKIDNDDTNCNNDDDQQTKSKHNNNIYIDDSLLLIHDSLEQKK